MILRRCSIQLELRTKPFPAGHPIRRIRPTCLIRSKIKDKTPSPHAKRIDTITPLPTTEHLCAHPHPYREQTVNTPSFKQRKPTNIPINMAPVVFTQQERKLLCDFYHMVSALRDQGVEQRDVFVTIDKGVLRGLLTASWEVFNPL